LFAEILNQLWTRVTAEQETPYRADQPLRAQLRLQLMAKMQMLGDDNFLDLARVAIAATIHSLSAHRIWWLAWVSAKKA
jgi:TetR/AcrR family transcriptional regulator of autoinduction and epiphytic fitness